MSPTSRQLISNPNAALLRLLVRAFAHPVLLYVHGWRACFITRTRRAGAVHVHVRTMAGDEGRTYRTCMHHVYMLPACGRGHPRISSIPASSSLLTRAPCPRNIRHAPPLRTSTTQFIIRIYVGSDHAREHRIDISVRGTVGWQPQQQSVRADMLTVRACVVRLPQALDSFYSWKRTDAAHR